MKKQFLAYTWDNDFAVWFFDDDLSDVRFSMWNRGSTFGLYPSKNVSFTKYVYDRDTLKLTQTENLTIYTSNAYNYGHEFMASFNIYTDKNYSSYFYESKNNGGNSDKPITEFEPLESDEAKDFLKYISNAGLLVNIENELPEYYNFLIGNIQNSEEELQTKVSFLTYLYYCLDAQLAQAGERIDFGTTYLIKWVGANTETSNIIYSEVKGTLFNSLKRTIAENADIPVMQIAGLNIATAIIEYGDLFIVSLGSIKEVRTRDEIMYLLAYKRLLEAKATNDEISISEAEFDCDWIIANPVFGGDFEKMEKFVGYLFNIEQSLPV